MDKTLFEEDIKNGERFAREQLESLNLNDQLQVAAKCAKDLFNESEETRDMVFWWAAAIIFEEAANGEE